MRKTELNKEDKVVLAYDWESSRPNKRFYNFKEKEMTIGELIDSGKMYIILDENAASNYINREGRGVNYDWANKMERLEGMALEVETDCLFNNQYNTEKLRIMDTEVKTVINDKRIGVYKCGYCGNMQKESDICKKCEREKYLEKLWE